MGGPEEAEGLSDAMTRSLFDLESLTVYFCLTCGELATLPEMNLEDRWKENWEAGRRGEHRRTDRRREGALIYPKKSLAEEKQTTLRGLRVITVKTA